MLTSISQLESIAFLTWIMTSISYTRVQGRKGYTNLSLCCLLRPLSIRDRDRDLHGHVSVRGRRRYRLANRVCYSKLHRCSHILYMRPSDHPPDSDGYHSTCSLRWDTHSKRSRIKAAMRTKRGDSALYGVVRGGPVADSEPLSSLSCTVQQLKLLSGGYLFPKLWV